MTTDRNLESSAQGLGAKPALLVIDIVEGFTDPECPLGSDADEVVEANCRLIDAFHLYGFPVILTTVIYHSAGQATVFRARIPALNLLTTDSHWVAFDKRLPITPDDFVVEKTHASGFHGTNLNEQLRALDVDSVVVTGLTTSGCVRATAVDALQYNYKVVVPIEAVGDRNIAAHRANLFDLNAKYADVLPLAEVLDALEHCSSRSTGA
ncbi:MAG: hypothetical protein RLZZ602_550 [Pseudomonadota bacterium]